MFHAATGIAAWYAGPVAGALTALLGLVLGLRFFLDDLPPVFTDQLAIAQAVEYWLAALALLFGLSQLRIAFRGAERGAQRAERLANRVRRRNAESRRTASRYRALSEVAGALLPALKPAQVRDLVLGRGATAVDASVALLVTAEDGGTSVSHDESCSEELAAAVAESALVRRSLSEAGARWVSTDELIPDAGDLTACDVWGILPLSVRDRGYGLLVLGYRMSSGITEAYRTIAELLAQQCAQALERARLDQVERSLRVQAQFAERQMGFLAVAGSALSATLDTTRSLAEVADLAATNLGGFCAIHLYDGDRPTLVAGSLTSESGLIRFGGDEDRYVLRDDSTLGYPAVLASGEPQLVEDLDTDALADAADSPEHAARLSALGVRSQICVPLEVRDTMLGALTVASTEPGRRLAPSELPLVENIARRVAQAVDAAQLYRTAVQASRAKSSFLAVMSHELRTPLNAILGYADLILMGVPAAVEPETQHQVERIRYSAAHLLELVEDVLNFARVDAGRDRVLVETVLLEEAVIEAVGMVQPLASSKGLTLDSVVPDGATMNTDRAKLLRILHNLLSNAAKFTTRGGVNVLVEMDEPDVVIEVRDTGIGIEPDNRERIFDPFWQVEQIPTRQHGGTGIGLGVARQLARLLGGDITVESEIGAGSTFTVRLPAHYEALPPASV